MLWAVILIRIVANPFSNVFQKQLAQRGVDPLAVILATHAALTILCIPYFLIVHPVIPPTAWVNLILCAALAVAGNTLIVAAVKHSDLSVLGPINAYKAIVSLIPGIVLLGEFPGFAGGAGMVMIVAGSYFVVDQPAAGTSQNLFTRLLADRGIRYRLAALVFSAVEAVFLKRAIQQTTPVAAFALWCELGFVIALPPVLIRRGARIRFDLARLQVNWTPYALLVLTTGLMQLTTLLTFRSFQVGYALSLFQTSTLISVVLGHRIFNERHFVRRLIGSGIMMAGAGMIVCAR